ncbi:hypothetical protein BJF79_39880 [Actinomadura sp. CNU-125]|nr:hypothetical protein BJF79_39880 [Actinomadura sp. CNU-125]
MRLEGERTVLRPFGLDDAAVLIEVMRAQETWLPPNFPTALDAETIAWFLREGVHKVQQYGLGLHLAITGEDGALIGTIGLFRVEWAQGTCEVGYGMRPSARGKGYATEALRLVSDWALRDCGLYRVELRALTSNAPSIRVAEKARFWREGRARGGERDADGVNQDMFVFSRTAPDVQDAGPPRLVPVDVGPGDPELVTVRALRLLHEADTVLVTDAPEAPVRAHTTRVRRVGGDPAAAVLDALDDGARTVAFALGDPSAFRDACARRRGRTARRADRSAVPRRAVPARGPSLREARRPRPGGTGMTDDTLVMYGGGARDAARRMLPKLPDGCFAPVDLDALEDAAGRGLRQVVLVAGLADQAAIVGPVLGEITAAMAGAAARRWPTRSPPPNPGAPTSCGSPPDGSARAAASCAAAPRASWSAGPGQWRPRWCWWTPPGNAWSACSGVWRGRHGRIPCGPRVRARDLPALGRRADRVGARAAACGERVPRPPEGRGPHRPWRGPCRTGARAVPADPAHVRRLRGPRRTGRTRRARPSGRGDDASVERPAGRARPRRTPPAGRPRLGRAPARPGRLGLGRRAGAAAVLALVLARLGPRTGDMVWDIGPGDGSVAAECARFGAAAIAVGPDARSCERIRAAVRARRVRVAVSRGTLPSVLDHLPDPDAVFLADAEPSSVRACAARALHRFVATTNESRVPQIVDVLDEAGFTVQAATLRTTPVVPQEAPPPPTTLVWARRAVPEPAPPPAGRARPVERTPPL